MTQAVRLHGLPFVSRRLDGYADRVTPPTEGRRNELVASQHAAQRQAIVSELARLAELQRR